MAPLKPIAIIPVFNERAHIGKLLERFPPREQCALVVIDDGSDDGTSEEIRRHNVPVVRHEVRSGVGACLQDGIAYAAQNGFDTVVVMAGNGKDDPQEIPRLLTAIEQGMDYVQGSRFLQGGAFQNLPRGRWFGVKGLTWVWCLVMGRRLTDVTNGFRAYRMTFLNLPGINWRQPGLRTYEFEYYVHYWALKKGVRFCEVPVSKNYPTKKNYSKIKPGRDWWRIIKPLFLLRLGVWK